MDTTELVWNIIHVNKSSIQVSVTVNIVCGLELWEQKGGKALGKFKVVFIVWLKQDILPPPGGMERKKEQVLMVVQ